MSMRWYQHALRKFEARLQARNQLCYLALIQSLGEFLVAIAASVVAAEAFHGGAALLGTLLALTSVLAFIYGAIRMFERYAEASGSGKREE